MVKISSLVRKHIEDTREGLITAKLHQLVPADAVLGVDNYLKQSEIVLKSGEIDHYSASMIHQCCTEELATRIETNSKEIKFFFKIRGKEILEVLKFLENYFNFEYLKHENGLQTMKVTYLEKVS